MRTKSFISAVLLIFMISACAHIFAPPMSMDSRMFAKIPRIPSDFLKQLSAAEKDKKYLEGLNVLDRVSRECDVLLLVRELSVMGKPEKLWLYCEKNGAELARGIEYVIANGNLREWIEEPLSEASKSVLEDSSYTDGGYVWTDAGGTFITFYRSGSFARHAIACYGCLDANDAPIGKYPSLATIVASLWKP